MMDLSFPNNLAKCPRPPSSGRASSRIPTARNSSGRLSISTRARTAGHEDGTGPQSLLPAASRILELCQIPFDGHIDFIMTNRAVAVLEKAVERLQLLALLDDDNLGTVPVAAKISQTHSDHSVGMMDPTSTLSNSGPQTSIFRYDDYDNTLAPARGAALFTRNGFDFDGAAAMRATYSAVSAALVESAKNTYRGRPTVAELLKKQQQLETRYEEVLHASRLKAPLTESSMRSNELFGKTGDAEEQEIQHELIAVSTQLREHRRVLCTQLKDNPNDLDNWRKISNERKELIALLRETITELTTGYQECTRHCCQRGNIQPNRLGASAFLNPGHALPSITPCGSGISNRSLSNAKNPLKDDNSGTPPSRLSHTNTLHTTLSRRFGSTMQMRRALKNVLSQPRIPLSSSFVGFTQKVLQEQAAQRWANALVRKQKELNQNVKQLQKNMEQERTLKECELAERRAKIAELRLQIREKKRALEERTLETRSAMEAATEGQKRKAEEEQRELRKNMLTNQRLLQVESDTHKMFVEFLHERIQELEAMAVGWSRKTQTKLKWIEEMKLDAEQTRQQCSERLRECEAEMKVQLDLEAQREEQRRREMAATAAEEHKREVACEAASKLQSAVRAMLTRLALKKLKKGSKKKGKSKA